MPCYITLFNLLEIYHNLLDLHNASVTVAKIILSIKKYDNKKGRKQ